MRTASVHHSVAQSPCDFPSQPASSKLETRLASMLRGKNCKQVERRATQSEQRTGSDVVSTRWCQATVDLLVNENRPTRLNKHRALLI